MMRGYWASLPILALLFLMYVCGSWRPGKLCSHFPTSSTRYSPVSAGRASECAQHILPTVGCSAPSTSAADSGPSSDLSTTPACTSAHVAASRSMEQAWSVVRPSDEPQDAADSSASANRMVLIVGLESAARVARAPGPDRPASRRVVRMRLGRRWMTGRSWGEASHRSPSRATGRPFSFGHMESFS